MTGPIDPTGPSGSIDRPERADRGADGPTDAPAAEVGHLSRTRIRDLLERHGLSPSRALGQNFLCDGGTVDKIVRLAGVGPGDHVVEIGPGLGSLTLGLCRSGASVVSIEVDRYLVAALREVVAPHERAGRLRIVESDVREVDWSDVYAGSDPQAPWAVVANLPYNIATPLILDLLVAQPRLSRWVVMVQREAGERLVAPPGSKIYGIPSVLLSYHASARLVGSVGAELFLPRPNVESVLVRIDRHAPGSFDGDGGADYDRIATLVRTAFGQRRKMLRRSLAALVTEEELTAAGIVPTARPEEIGIEAWRRLASVAP